MARFGSSAFGPLSARAVSADGVPGNWMHLGTLVRVPSFRDLRCPHATSKPCTLTGSNLFLVDSIAPSQDFSNATEVPPGFTGAQITVPHPANGVLYLKLRDDPEIVQSLNLPVTPVGPPPVTAPAGTESKTGDAAAKPDSKADSKSDSKKEPKADADTGTKPETKAQHDDDQ
jgi:hypothetical protein